MKKQKLLLLFCLICFSISNFAEETQKASEMQMPIPQPSSKKAQKKAHKKVEAKKQELLKKLKNNDSPEAIGNAKARVQIERTESNMQDYMESEKKEKH